MGISKDLTEEDIKFRYINEAITSKGWSKDSILPQFGITECLIQYKCSVHTPPSHAIRSG